jgi:outer membrane lipoprotein-sorting protein
VKALAAACACVLALGAGAQAQSEVGAIVDRASAYVEEFQRRFGSMVTEERYEQTVQEAMALGARARPQFERVVLVSDFLLVQVPGEGWMPFRDVFERNGQKLRDREERLAKLFLNGTSRSSFDQARQIMLEGARYNIGTIERTINLPTLPLVFLTPGLREKFRFEVVKRDPEEGTVVEYHEVRTPTYVSDREGHDMPSTGRFWLDEGTGAVRRTELDVVHTSVEAHIKVSYRFDEGLTLWVPARMEERYRDRRTTSEVRGVATYSRFRKFQVSTSEEIAQ